MTAPDCNRPPARAAMPRRSSAPARRRFAPRPLALALASASLLSLPLADISPAHAQQAALPSGMAVVHGQASAVVNGNRMTVTNSANSILNWNSFSIGAGNGVHFAQPDAASKVLNRVVGNDPSAILGSLSSNGGVWLLNPHGVLFGQGARVDVGHLVTSTLRLNDIDWLNGRFNFAAAGTDMPAGIVNRGELRSSLGGHIALLGGSVANENLIEAPGGQVLLAAGRSIDLLDTGSPHLRLRVTAPADAALNLGTLAAAGGRIDVHGAVVNQQGVVRADSFGVNAAGEVVLQASRALEVGAGSTTSASGTGAGGRITVDAGREGTATIRGNLLASGGDGAGGQLTLLGQRIGLTDAARLDVSGASGGSMHIGGGERGQDAAYPNAQALFVGSGVTLKADAGTGSGDGGRIILWSDEATRAYGSFSARGGLTGGNGGFIETSGGWIDVRPAGIDASAPAGRAGSWLLDPGNITITSDTSDSGITTSSGNPIRYESNSNGARLQAQTIEAALTGGSSVIVATGNLSSSEPGDIFVSSATINPSAPGAVSLTLQAHRNIQISNSNIATRGGPLSVDLRANGAGAGGVVTIGSSTIETRGGSISANGAGFDVPASNGGTGSGVALSGATLIAGSGSVSLSGSSSAVNGFGNSGIALFSSPIQAGAITLNGSHGSTSGNGYYGVRVVGSSLTATGPLSISGSGSGTGVDASSGTTLRSGGGLAISGTNTRILSSPATDNHGVRISGDYGGLLQTTGGASISIVGSHRGGPAAALLLNNGLQVESAGTVNLTANSPMVIAAQITSPAQITLRADDVTLATGASLTSTAPDDAIVIAGQPNPNTSRFVNSAGAGALSTPAGRWLIYGQNSASVQPGGLPFNFQQYNARFGETAPAAPGNGLLYAEAQNVTISGNKLQKVYDGHIGIGPLSNASPTFSGQRNGDTATLASGANGTLDDPNVGVNKPVGVLPSAVTFRDTAGRPVFGYTLVSNLLGDVTRRPVSLTGVTAQNKVYDGSRAAQVGFTGLSGLVTGETLTATAAGLFDTKDAGTGKNVLVTGSLADGTGTGGGRASNYQLSPANTVVQADILRRQLTLTDPTAASKVYDGNRNATVGFTGLGNLVGSETLVTSATGLFDTKDVGIAKPVDVLVNIADGSNGGLASNYLAPTVPTLRADITPRPLQANSLAVADKTYDGTRSAAVTLGPLTGLVSGETLTGSATGLFDTKDVGTAKPVLVDVLLGNGGGGGLASNYRFVPPTNPTASIRPAALTVRANDASKTFGQTLAFNGTEFVASGLQAGETVGLVTLQSAGAPGTAPVGGSPYPIVASNARGGSFDPRNYDIQYRDGVLTVARAGLQSVLVGIVGNPTKTYDGSDLATLGPANFALSGFVGSDNATVTQTAGRYDSANAGSRTVTATLARPDFAPVGSTDLNNYNLPANASGAGTIVPRNLTLNGTRADSKVYDGSVSATLASVGTLGGLVGTQTLQVTAGSARFDTKDVGTGKTVTVGGIALADATGLASNYRISPTTTTSADITPRPLQANSLAVADKTYDGTRSAAVTLGPLTGLVSGETLTGSASGLFDTKDVGTAKPVLVDVLLGNGGGGGLASNYRFVPPTNPAASIRPAALTVRANDASKTFGQTLAFNGTEFVASGLQAGETVGLVTLQSAGAPGTAPVGGSPYPIVASNARGGSFDPRNYDIQYRDGVLTVARAGLQSVLVGIVGNPTKTYDGSDLATLGPANFALSGFVGSDNATVTQTAGRYDSANAGSRTVTATLARSDYAPAGSTDLNNYNLPASASGAGTIVPRNLTLNGTRADSKVYDGSVSATLASVGTLGGLVGTQTLQVTAGSARFDTKDVGTAKPVTVGGIALADATGLAANYRISPTTTTTADITPATLTYNADPKRKVVGEALPALTGNVSGFVASETQAGATTGTLRFETPATAASPAGLYAINGAGLAAGNYRFVQAPGNATALNVGDVQVSIVDESSRAALGQSVQAVTLAPAWSGPTEGRVFDVIQALRGSFLSQGALFRPIPVADLSRDTLSTLLAARDRYKKALFASAISRLEQDPTLADLPACASVQETDNGSCLITEDLKSQLKRQRATTQIALPTQPPSPAAAVAPPSPPVAAAPAPAPAPAPAAPAPDADAALAMIPPAAPREAVGTPVPESAPQPLFSRRVRTAALPQIARKIAIVVGIDNYADRRIPQLDNAVKDARTVGQVLEATLGYETVVLENATRASLVRTLNRLAVELDPNDSVVVYYAGHGELVQATGLGYWQLSDANPNRPETWMSNADISRLIGRIGAQQVALISDSCYSGSLVDERIRARPGSVDPQELLARKSVVVMSSGGNEPVFDEGKNGHSPFAFSLMRNLEQVANWQVGGNVFERVRFAVARELPQRPVYGSAASAGHQAGGDYLFEQRQLAP